MSVVQFRRISFFNPSNLSDCIFLLKSSYIYLQVILTTLLKVYARGGLFEKSKELLAELEFLGYAEDEVY